MVVEVKINTQVLESALRALGKDAKPTIARVLSRTITGVKTLAADIVSSQLNLKAAAVKKRLSVRRSFGSLTASLIVAAKPSPLLDFKGTTFAKESRRGVSFRRSIGGDRIRLKHAFILAVGSGRRVFEHDYAKPKRMSAKRKRLEHPLKATTSTFVVQILRRARELRALHLYATRRFETELRRDLVYRLDARAARARLQ